MGSVDRNSKCKVQSIRSQLAALVQLLQIDLAVWRNSHLSGWRTLKSILQIQDKYLNMEGDLSKLRTKRQLAVEADKQKRLRRELNSTSSNLQKLVVRLENANKRTRTSLKLLRLWTKDCQVGHIVFYRSWPLTDILDFFERIMRLYDAEYEIKEMVAEDIATAQTHEQLRIFGLLWRYPRHALTPEFNAMFEKFNKETKSTK